MLVVGLQKLPLLDINIFETSRTSSAIRIQDNNNITSGCELHHVCGLMLIYKNQSGSPKN